jgi:CRISPR-associated protein Csm3
MEMHIGGTDNPVLKHPHTLEPYIPGSSIKGKLRSLMELNGGTAAFSYSKSPRDGGIATFKTLQEAQEPEKQQEIESILKIFGFSGSDKSGNDNKAELARKLGPTRASFSDCYLNREWKEKATANLWPLAVEKSETAIDRISGTAKRGSLRQTEMVPAGAEFDFKLTFKIFCDEDQKLLEKLKAGLKLMEKDAIGGNGSRGYGRFRFENLEEI